MEANLLTAGPWAVALFGVLAVALVVLVYRVTSVGYAMRVRTRRAEFEITPPRIPPPRVDIATLGSVEATDQSALPDETKRT